MENVWLIVEDVDFVLNLTLQQTSGKHFFTSCKRFFVEILDSHSELLNSDIVVEQWQFEQK